MKGIMLGYCDEIGSKGMTLHQMSPECPGWKPVQVVLTPDEPEELAPTWYRRTHEEEEES